jgi:hypothetical protein
MISRIDVIGRNISGFENILVLNSYPVTARVPGRIHRLIDIVIEIVVEHKRLFADTIGHLIYDVEMAHRQLSRALETRVYLERLDAVATAQGYLVSAQTPAT